MTKDNDIVTWDVPYKQKKDGSPDRIISVRAPRNASKSEVQELAQIEIDKVTENNRQKEQAYEESKTPLQKTIGENAYGVVETIGAVGTSPLAFIMTGFKEEWKKQNPDKAFPKWVDWADGYNPTGKKSQDWLTTFAKSEMAKLIQGLPPTLGGGFSSSLRNQAIKKQKLRTKNSLLGKKSERPTAKQIKDDAQASYNRAEEVGATIKQSNFKNWADRLEEALGAEGYDPLLGTQNSIMVTIKRLRELANKKRPIRLDELERYRKMALNATRELDSTTAKLGGDLIGEIDDFANSLNKNSLVSGTDEAVTALKDARMNWKRKVKINELEWLNERSNIKQGVQTTNKSAMEVMRQEVGALLTNKKRRRGWSAEEIKSLKDFAQGGKWDKTLQRVSGFAPERFAFGGGVSLGGPALIGAYFGGPTGAAVAAGGAYGTGLAAKAKLNSRSTNKMGNIMMDIATGGQPNKYKPGVNLNTIDTSAAFPLVPRSLLDLYDPNYEEEGYGIPSVSKSLLGEIPN